MTVHNRLYHMKQKTESGSCFGLPVNSNWVTVHRALFREVFWHVCDKIPRHTSQNSIAKGNLE